MAFESLRERRPLGLARTGGFYLSVVAFAFFWFLAFNFQLLAVFRVWFDPNLADTVHFVHDVGLATFVWVWGLAMLVQLYRPARRVTAMQVALVLTLVDAGVSTVAATFEPSALMFFGPVVVAAALHPARGDLLALGTVDRDDLDPALLALAGLAVVPVTLYAIGQVNFQLDVADEHAELGHYSTMAYYTVSFVALAALAGIGTRGRRFAVYGAGAMAAVLAIASVVRPTPSALDGTWAALAVLWALAVVGAYEWNDRRASPSVAPAERPAH